jgi:molybdenum cofactor cytidylyltransferase
MKFGPIPVSQAEGKILAHNLARPDSRGAFRKGKTITAQDVAEMVAEGFQRIYAAELEDGDLDEDEAARRLAEAAVGGGLRLKGPADGRVNLVAEGRGVVRVDPARLERVNSCEGVTFATLPSWTLVEAGQAVATVKIIPYALSAAILDQAVSAAAGDSPLIQVSELKSRRVGLVFSALPAALGRVVKSFETPLRNRIEGMGSTVAAVNLVRLEGGQDEDVLAEALRQQVAEGIEMIVMASDTSIMDRNDVTPRAVVCAGGQVDCIGAPVEPGNLLMLASLARIPVVGVPGCVRSPKPTVVDRVLPALLAGDRLDAADVARLGYGGLIEHGNHNA